MSTLTDSEKISAQVALDVRAFTEHVREFDAEVAAAATALHALNERLVAGRRLPQPSDDVGASATAAV